VIEALGKGTANPRLAQAAEAALQRVAR
jgi:hypothetical protein